jgi:hypothetical protein
MIMTDQAVRTMPARKLVRILAQEFWARLAWRLTRRSGHRAIFWKVKGAGIELQKKYKGIK